MTLDFAFTLTIPVSPESSELFLSFLFFRVARIFQIVHPGLSSTDAVAEVRTELVGEVKNDCEGGSSHKELAMHEVKPSILVLVLCPSILPDSLH